MTSRPDARRDKLDCAESRAAAVEVDGRGGLKGLRGMGVEDMVDSSGGPSCSYMWETNQILGRQVCWDFAPLVLKVVAIVLA